MIDIPRLIEMGYRRVSNKYGTVSRVDRPDWIHFLALELNIPIEILSDIYNKRSNNYANHYRRVFSKDRVTLDPVLAKQIPSSDWDQVGYVEVEDEECPVR